MLCITATATREVNEVIRKWVSRRYARAGEFPYRYAPHSNYEPFSKHNDPTAKQPNVPLGYRFRVGLVRVRIRVPRQGGGHHLPSPVTIISPSGKKSLTVS